MRTPKLIDLHPPKSDFKSDVRTGLGSDKKNIPPKYFYNERGSRLFEKITGLKEYYLTRAELEIFENWGDKIADHIGAKALVIEYGSGSSLKIELLLTKLDEPTGYVPVDISKEHLLETAQEVQTKFPDLKVTPICADFSNRFELPNFHEGRRIVFFPGSTIGNFTPEQSMEILKMAAEHVGKGGGLLLGADLEKDEQTLLDAYSDGEGVTAEFNINLLRRMNSELGTKFNLDKFQHRATYNREKHRMESYLVSVEDQTIEFENSAFSFKAGETIHTENSYKFSIESIQSLCKSAGFRAVKYWTDEKNLFSVHYFEIN